MRKTRSPNRRCAEPGLLISCHLPGKALFWRDITNAVEMYGQPCSTRPPARITFQIDVTRSVVAVSNPSDCRHKVLHVRDWAILAAPNRDYRAKRMEVQSPSLVSDLK